ncbi:hypothetical protein NE237_004870 [Protea cynaroides]|uniref:FAD-binding PCMH-type domain-containing protein n=1 Tax=Protea cynaroides TaxID=273540 RepID=A0A9Q0KJR5_9MAGN|nr:hypothetical protein NE237_004870 [Protea cynaroides]
MDPFVSAILTILVSVFMSSSISLATSNSTSENFLSCLSTHSEPSNPISAVLYTPTNSSFSSILQSTIQNLRFLSSTTNQPLFIITPTNDSHIQAAVICSSENGLQIKVRSGGHDYEGLSYRSNVEFIIIDLRNLRSVTVDTENGTAWVEAGATLGEVYYHIANKSNTLGFPAGLCPTVGVGGHFSGGGIGTLMRKYGLAADNIIDAYIVDVEGIILDRKSMGEDLFWAIRGGGASFGIILSWKINLVSVPPTVTVFEVSRTLNQNATQLLNKWQYIANKFDEDLFVRAVSIVESGATKAESTILVVFQSLFLGSITELLPLMQQSFPELGLQAQDCTEMSWINSTLYFAGYTVGESIDVLLNRTLQPKAFYKGKSDFVTQPISLTGFESIWTELIAGNSSPVIIMDPLGGRMSNISATATPFPHRAGNLYTIQYYMYWQGGGTNTTTDHLESMKEIYNFMSPYVSKSPRAAYFNYKDLDLGIIDVRNTSYTEASVWGNKYFKNNFKKLAVVKKKVDPTNFFWDEQSIPPLH